MIFGQKKDVLWLKLIGLGGIPVQESKSARRVGKVFSYLVIFIAIGLLFQWQLEEVRQLPPWLEPIINWVVWSFFVIEYIWFLYIVKDKKRVMQQNWLLPVIILAGLALLFDYQRAEMILRNIRPFFALVILLPSLRLMIKFLVDGQLWTTFLAAAVLVIIFGLLVSGIDPSIHSAWDGIWWALATVSTVGYGDVVPTSWLGRLIGVALLVLGLGIFVVITANFLSIMLRNEKELCKKEGGDIETIEKELSNIKSTQELILKNLDDISKNGKK